MSLTYKIIRSDAQYIDYCRQLEELAAEGSNQDEIELLTLLIEKWDQEHQTLTTSDPIDLLKFLMSQKHIKAKDLVDLLGVSKGLVSDILNRKKGMSKEVIRCLANYFRLSQEAFNKPYPLVRESLPRTKKPTLSVNLNTKLQAH